MELPNWVDQSRQRTHFVEVRFSKLPKSCAIVWNPSARERDLSGRIHHGTHRQTAERTYTPGSETFSRRRGVPLPQSILGLYQREALL